MDPLDFSYDRFRELYEAISDVIAEFAPKDPLQIAAYAAEAQIEQEKLEDAIERGIDINNPLFDPSELNKGD
jgi:hypothetical protein